MLQLSNKLQLTTEKYSGDSQTNFTFSTYLFA